MSVSKVGVFFWGLLNFWFAFFGCFYPAAHHIPYHWFPFVSSIFDSLESDEVAKRRLFKEPLDTKKKGVSQTGRFAIPV